MRIVRDEQGKIIQIVKDESDGDINVVDVFKAEIEVDANKEIAKEQEITAREREITEREKEITLRTKEKCNFFLGCTSVAAKAIIAGIDEYNRQQKISNYNNGLNASEDDC